MKKNKSIKSKSQPVNKVSLLFCDMAAHFASSKKSVAQLRQEAKKAIADMAVDRLRFQALMNDLDLDLDEVQETSEHQVITLLPERHKIKYHDPAYA